MALHLQQIALWSKFDPPSHPAETELFELVIGAVTAHIIASYRVPEDADEFTDTENLAVALQVSRLWRRRDTPQGAAAFADVAAIRVDRLDGDVAALLCPKFGFA